MHSYFEYGLIAFLNVILLNLAQMVVTVSEIGLYDEFIHLAFNWDTPQSWPIKIYFDESDNSISSGAYAKQLQDLYNPYHYFENMV